MCTEIPETKNSPELCHRWIDVLLTCQLMQSTSAPCTDMPGIRAARMLCSSGEGAVRALSTSHSHYAMPQPTVVLPPAAAHAAFAGDKPFLGSPFAACPTARSCLHPPLASAPAHGPVCDPLSVLPVPDKPEELWLDPDRGSLRWKALPSCKGEIIGYQVPGQTLTSGSGAVCRQTGKCGKGTHFPASEYLALMSTNIFRFILNIPHAVEMPREVVSVSGPLGLLPGSALLWAWQTSEDWCARHGDVSSGVASQGFLCLLHTCFWFLPQKNLWFE